MRSRFCVKGYILLFPLKTLNILITLLPFEKLFRDANSLNSSSFDKECVKSRLQDCAYSSFKQVSKISDKNLPDEEIKPLKNLIENKDLLIQKADKGNTIVILNKNDYISRL